MAISINKKTIAKITIALFALPIILICIVTIFAYWQQDKVVQQLLTNANKDFKGNIEIKDSHISLFENFPYISIDLEETKIFEDKNNNNTPLLTIHDIYLGFDLWTILNGKMEIKKIKLKNGNLNLIQHIDGEFNITKAFSTSKKIENTNEEFHLNLQEIKLEDIDISKLNEQDSITIDAFISKATLKFKTSPDHIYAYLNSKFQLTLAIKGDTTFVKNKHFEAKTEIDYITETGVLSFKPTVINLEGSEFNFEGSIDVLDSLNLDLKFNGSKPNFDLLFAVAPEELIPVLKKYENKGHIYFDAIVKGKSTNGHNPFIEAKFGCKDAYFNNYAVNKKLEDLNFVGHFTNGDKRDITTMEFHIEDFSARPEAGTFSGNLHVRNFQSPDIQLKLKSDFELEFLSKFLNLEGVRNLTGKISLTMNFHDIIDLSSPEKSIEKLNESYFTQLKIEDLGFKADAYALPIKNLNLYAELNGHEAKIDYFNVSVGKSDLAMSGTISDLPAIIHHTNIPVKTILNIKSNYLDLFELTGSDTSKSVNEQIQNLALGFTFKSTARAFTESPNLPTGEFFIDNLYAKLKHYPHTLHDFHADLFIEKEDFKVVDFKGMIDKSDFLFSGRLKHYDLWFEESPDGDTKLEFNLTSNFLKFENLFSYKGENFVPEDYRHEELDKLKIHGFAELHFKKDLKSIDVYFDKFDAKMKIHPLRFENFKGRVHYEDNHLVVENFMGKLGRSDFKTNVHYYFGNNESIKKRENHIDFISSRLDLDELLNYTPATSKKVDHDAGFNIYELPFTNMTFDFKIDNFNYHRYNITNIDTKLRTTPNHYIYIDKLFMNAAGGSFDIKGYLNGSDPKKIYLSPKMKLDNIDLDKLLFKFENFGQDHLVSENLHGKLSGVISGNIRMHNDLVPIIEESEIHIDMNVVNGRLENYAMLDLVSDYFSDKNLKKVIFDTLANHIDLTKGVLNIPQMTINSSIGFIKFSGKQDLNMNMEYYISVPWKLVTNAAASKLFGKKSDEVDPETVDAIQYADPEKRTKFVNIKLTGNPDNYNISLGKEKKKS